MIEAVCFDCHAKRTKLDVAAKAVTARIRKRALGIKKRSTFPNSRDGKWKTKIGGRTEPRIP
jgi:hypothetical protein